MHLSCQTIAPPPIYNSSNVESIARDGSIRTSTTSTPVRFTSAKQTPTPCSLAPVSPHKHGSFQHWLHLEGGHSRAWVFYHRLARYLCRAAAGSASASVLVSSTPRTLTPSYTRADQAYDIHDTPRRPIPRRHCCTREPRCEPAPVRPRSPPGMPDVVSTYQSYAPRSAAV